MARVTVRQTRAELPDLPDKAELARVESLAADLEVSFGDDH
jgi:hypothetical protein